MRTKLSVVLHCHLLFDLTAVQLEARTSCMFLSLTGVLKVLNPRLWVCLRRLWEEIKNTLKVQREKQQILILFFSPTPSRDTRSAPLANEAITDIIMRPLLMQTASYYVPNTQTIPSIEAN